MNRKNTFAGVISVGQRVYCGLYGGKDGIVVAVHGEQTPRSCSTIAGGAGVFGGSAYIDIIWDSGAKSLKTPESLVRSSIQWNVFDEIADTDAILDAVENAKRYDLRTTAAIEGTDARRRAEREEHKANHPHLIAASQDNPSNYALAAKNIRIELKRNFPGVKFSVTTDYNSVRIAWENGPTKDEVGHFTNCHSSGTFDSMTDCQGWDYDNTFGQVFGESRYIWNEREISNETLEVVGRDYCQFNDIEFKSMDQTSGRDQLWTIARIIAFHYSIPIGHKVIGIESTDVTCACAGDYFEFYRLVTEPIAAAELEQKKKAASLPVFNDKNLLSMPKYTWSAQVFKKTETAEKAAAKARKAGFDVEVVYVGYRSGDYAVRLIEAPAPKAIEKLPLQQRVTRLAQRIDTQYQATKLWNWIDNQPEPEPLWQIMLDICPWAFAHSAFANSIRFVYDRKQPEAEMTFVDDFTAWL